MKKTAIVTGCAKGIGREIAIDLARYGYNIIGTFNTSLEDIDSLDKKIDMLGVKFYKYNLDLLNDDSINNFIKDIKSNFNHIDLLVNNAALSKDDEFDLKTSNEFIDILKVNLVGPFSLIQGLYKLMDKGIIINISSTDGIDTYQRLNIDYSASKAGLINLTKSLALILDNIKVYAICPNWVDTESIREMNKDYLKEEMKRIHQRKLIDSKTISKKVIDLINSKKDSGSIIIMGDNDDR